MRIGSKAVFPAGRYYVGDPCYVIEDWDPFIDQYHETEGETDEGSALVHVNGVLCWVADCVEGESEYTDGVNRYDNDTTLLGLVPEALVKPEGPDDEGPIQDFPKDFEVERTGDGILYIGHLMIDTAHPVDELADEWDEDEEDGCCGGGCDGECGCDCIDCQYDTEYDG